MIPAMFHVEWAGPNTPIRELMLAPDEHGVYAGFYKAGDWAKFTTFFPQHFGEKEIQKVIDEAFKNRIQKGNYSFVGQAASGMKIRIVFKQYGQDVEAYTAYPLYKNVEDPRVHVKALGKDRIAYKIKKDVAS